MNELKKIALELLERWVADAGKAADNDSRGSELLRVAERQTILAEKREYLDRIADCGAAQDYEYGFTVWPDGQSPRWNKYTHQLFELLKGRLVMEFSAPGFNNFREGLAQQGFTLREIERRPATAYETVL